jgi:adenine-specific DNA-methyltransferase
MEERVMSDQKVPKTINDFISDNIQALASLFPAAVKDGQVDFTALKEELGQFEEAGKEKYELTWAGKQEAKKKAQEDVFGRTLKYIHEDSKNPETTENLYIEGDNLEVLKLLRQNYYGSIKMIYIDPPYNTGNDFVYNDDFKMDAKESDIAEGTLDEYGERLQKNQKSTNRFHANWLNMMYPRLKVAKDLLTNDGVIFISVDDNEVTNMRKICDLIFGEENFVADLIWSNKEGGGSSDSKLFRIKHEHILCYAKNINNITILGVPISNAERYKSQDQYVNVRGNYYLQKLGMGSIQYSTSLDYPIDAPDGTTINPADNNNGKKACWRWSKTKYDWGKKNGFIEIKKDSSGVWTVYTKQYMNCDNNGNIITRTQRPMGIIDEFSSTQASKYLYSIEIGGLFNYSKPYDLIVYLINRISEDNDIILDFFSGSATTAHAVIQSNLNDGKKRKFIMVQVPEEVEEKSEAYSAGYANICEIGKERIRRSGEQIKNEIEEINKQLKIGEDPKMVPDIGFKVFRTADTNIKWNLIESEGQMDTEAMTHTPDLADFTFGFNDIDVVYEIMLRQKDIPLSEKLEVLSDIGARTYLYGSAYLICLEIEITEDLIDQLASLNPLPIKFVFRDSAFKDDINLKDDTFRRLKNLIDRNSGDNKNTYTVEFI